MTKTKETKVLLTELEDEKLEKLAEKEGRSKTNFCTQVIKNLLACPNKNCVGGIITRDGQTGKVCKFCNKK